jgi:hypothetical protein
MLDWKRPIEHIVQALAPAEEYTPRPQLEQLDEDEEPTSVENEPAGQFVHTEEPLLI